MNAKQRRTVVRRYMAEFDSFVFRTKCRVTGQNPIAVKLNDVASSEPYAVYALVRKALLAKIVNDGDSVLQQIIKADVEADRRKYDDRN